MKNTLITALTLFAFATSPMMAGERSFDMENAFAYSKSTQSTSNDDNSGSFAAGLSSGEATGLIVFLGIVILGVLIASSGGSNNYGGGGGGGQS